MICLDTHIKNTTSIIHVIINNPLLSPLIAKLISSVSLQTKLDFGSPKPPRREVLEEEASIDFVFIPPEAKERVLTEHQKEVKRTKRSGLPSSACFHLLIWISHDCLCKANAFC